MPIFAGGSAEDLLHFLYEFNQARARLGYTTYQKLESGIEQLLVGTARNEWNTIKGTVSPNANTVASFASHIDAFRRIYIPEPAAIDNQKMYLCRIRKNDKYTVPQFLDRLKHINMLLSQFPGASEQDSFSLDEIKRLFYQAMPTRWRTNFINSGQSLMTTSIESLRTYTVQQEQQTDAHRKKTRENNKKSNQGHATAANNRKGQKTSKRTAASGSNREKKKKKLSNDDDCPIHGSSHKWGQCHQNQYGDNFRPRRDSASASASGQGANRFRRNTSHYTNQTPPANIQVYHNDTSSRTDTRSRSRNSPYSQQDQQSTSSFSSARNSSFNPNVNSYYQGQDNYVCEAFANEKDETMKIDYLPEGNILLRYLNDAPVDAFGLCLFVSGSTTTLLNQRALPNNITPRMGTTQQFTTTQGTYQTQEYVVAREIIFPDFCKSRKIPQVNIRLFNSPTSRYDVIVGRDILTSGFVLDHSHNVITWDGLSVPMTPLRTPNAVPPVATYFQCTDTAKAVYATGGTPILDAKYDRINPHDVAHQCTHLSATERDKLYTLLAQFSELFSGKLGRYVKQTFSIHLKDSSVNPIFCNPYSVPLAHQQVFKKELQHLIDEKVLQRIPRSEWAFPTFLISKKDGRVRWISDFRKLNKLLKRSRYFLPSIPAIMQKRAGFTHISKIDLSMGFYTFALDKAAQRLCVISTVEECASI